MDVARQWVEKQGLLPSSEELPLRESFPGSTGLLTVSTNCYFELHCQSVPIAQYIFIVGATGCVRIWKYWVSMFPNFYDLGLSISIAGCERSKIWQGSSHQILSHGLHRLVIFNFLIKFLWSKISMVTTCYLVVDQEKVLLWWVACTKSMVYFSNSKFHQSIWRDCTWRRSILQS